MRNFLLLLLFIPMIIFGQGNGRSDMKPNITVTGLVLDSLNEKALSYATISFLNIDNDQLITGGICDESGVFSVENVPVGAYKILIEYIGYTPKIIEKIRVMPNRNQRPDFSKPLQKDIGTFYLSKSANVLEEIDLVEEKAFVVQGIDRKIFNVDQDLTSCRG